LDYRKALRVKPGEKLKLSKIDPAYRGKHESEVAAKEETERYIKKLARQQTLLYADDKRSVLVVLQAMDASGKDGTIKHVFSGVNPQGVDVASFKQPTPLELAHDFLWRVHAKRRKPARSSFSIGRTTKTCWSRGSISSSTKRPGLSAIGIFGILRRC
jgi:polyphosphate kinase 2 (PPK2 family)